MNLKNYSGLLAIFLLATGLQAQQASTAKVAKSASAVAAADSSSLLFAFQHGRVQGNLRYFFMATDNAPGLTDYFANAMGGQLRYETAPFHRFQMALGGHYIYNIATSDLIAPDPTTAQPNRYEIGLFDIADAGNYRDLYRLEELYLKYAAPKLMLRVGKQLLNTPFINLQDGRMRPTAVEGIWANWQPKKSLEVEGGWLYRLSPRSTMHWYGVGESIGRYPVGLATTGAPSGYRDQLQSKGIFALAINWKPIPEWKVTGWNLLTEGIFNSALLQVEYGRKVRELGRLSIASQVVRQDAVGNAGNANTSMAYLPSGSHAWVLGGRLAWKSKVWDASLNYTRITSAGRYLMPREWGRDPFFTFMPRERTEGFGDVHAVVAKAERSLPKTHLKVGLAAGYVSLPAVNDFRLNKYGMPSYAQANAELRYQFPKPLQGMEAQLLVAGKLNAGDLRGNRRFEFNKVNMVNYNFVLNYNF